MSNAADIMMDRRRLRRKLTFWRVAAIAIAAVAIVAAGWWAGGAGLSGTASDHIAKIRIEGTITEDEELLERLKKVTESDSVKGVMLAIDSPGGTTAGGEAIYEAVRKLAKEKPVVAQVGTLAASAGYMIASASDHIVARQSSIVGSIGVLVQIPNVSKLLANIGVEVDTVKSAPLKAEPSPFNETTEQERAMMRAMILDSYDWFVGIVTERRPLNEAEVRQLADGSVFTGRQALTRKLVDELGGEDEAVAWLKKEKGLGEDLKVVEWKRKKETDLFGLPASTLFGGFGSREDQLKKIIAEVAGEGVFLDGLLSLWQPEKSLTNQQ